MPNIVKAMVVVDDAGSVYDTEQRCAAV
jgi:hypothetical protein